MWFGRLPLSRWPVIPIPRCLRSGFGLTRYLGVGFCGWLCDLGDQIGLGLELGSDRIGSARFVCTCNQPPRPTATDITNWGTGELSSLPPSPRRCVWLLQLLVWSCHAFSSASRSALGKNYGQKAEQIRDTSISKNQSETICIVLFWHKKNWVSSFLKPFISCIYRNKNFFNRKCSFFLQCTILGYLGFVFNRFFAVQMDGFSAITERTHAWRHFLHRFILAGIEVSCPDFRGLWSGN